MSADDIRREIEASRRAIQRDYTSLRAELDFVTKAKHSVANHPIPWLGSSALLGWLLSGRKKKPKMIKGKNGRPEPSRKFTLLGILLGVVRLVFPLIRPQLTDFALGKFSDYAGKSRRPAEPTIRGTGPARL